MYVDGSYHPRELAKVSVFDHGTLHGDGVFEGIRAYDGRVFEFDAHTNRLYPEDVYRTGLTVKICETSRTSSQCVGPAVKSCNYLNNIMAVDNFFMVKGGRMLTPSLAVGADEAFLTGTGAGVAPTAQVDLRSIGDDTPGPISRGLIQRFSAHAGRSGTAVYPA